MTSRPYRPSEEFLSLLDNFCAGELTAEQVRRFEAILQDDPRTRDFYTEYLAIHAGLGEMSFPTPACDETVPVDGPTSPLFTAGEETSLQCSAQSAAFPWGIPSRTLLVFCTLWIISSIIPWILTVIFLTQDTNREYWGSGRVVAAEPPAGIARLTGSIDTIWAHTTEEPVFGKTFQQDDRLLLVKGCAEITFNGGTRLLLEGPATVRLLGRNRVHLFKGRVGLIVPDEAEDFTVETDRIAVTQRGSESGLMLDPEGTVEAHVLRGMAEVWRNNDGEANGPGEASGFVLKAEQGVRLAAQEENLELISADATKFSINTARFGSLASAPNTGFVKGGPIGGTTVLKSQSGVLTTKPTAPGHALVYDLSFSTRAASFSVERRQTGRSEQPRDIRSGILGYAIPGQGGLGVWLSTHGRIGYGAFHDRNGPGGGDSRIDEWQFWEDARLTAEKQVAGDGVSDLDFSGSIRIRLDINDTGNDRTSRFQYTFEQNGNTWRVTTTFERLRKVAEEDAPNEGGRFVDSLIAKARDNSETVGIAYYVFTHGSDGTAGKGTVMWKNESNPVTVSGAD